MGCGGNERLNWGGCRPGNDRLNAGGCRNMGRLRKLADEIGRGRWCLNRIWILAVTTVSIITFVSLSNNSLLASVVYPSKLELRRPRGIGGFRWERRAEVIEPEFTFIPLNLLPDEGESPWTPYSARPTSTPVLTTVLTTRSHGAIDEGERDSPHIDDVVALPDGLDLFLVRNFADNSVGPTRITACNYGEQQKSRPRSIDIVHGRFAVSCTRPWKLQNPVRIRDISLDVDGGERLPLLPKVEYLEPAQYDDPLVYAIQSTEEDIILHAKGVFEMQRRKATEYFELESFQCLFGQSVQTNVTAAALGVYRCPHPKFNRQQLSTRPRVHLLYKGNPVPSIVYYEGPPPPPQTTENQANKHLVCSCTMVWNSAKFLKEWVVYNSDLGVSKFFLYDNNSEDDIEAVVSSLSQFNVTRTRWPWVKTQEAGFSHCAVVAQKECSWILFTDVDEYLFPSRWLQTNSLAYKKPPAIPGEVLTPLASLINTILKKGKSLQPSKHVGQISILCRNFGPTGLTSNPSNGVTQGYTCREKKEQRHKSLVFFPAMKRSLANVIHHFFLEPEYITISVDSKHAVVNHYKFQAWSEFETKFTRRASTYVTDWKESKNLKSRDRPEGIEIDGHKPPDWETSHCQLNDTALRDFTWNRFRVPGKGRSPAKLAWELI